MPKTTPATTVDLTNRLMRELSELRARRAELAASLARIDADLAAFEKLGRALAGSPSRTKSGRAKRVHRFSPGSLKQAVLAAVKKHPGYTPIQLVPEVTAIGGIEVTHGRVSSTLGRLVADGLVERTVSRKAASGRVIAYAYRARKVFKRRGK